MEHVFEDNIEENIKVCQFCHPESRRKKKLPQSAIT